MLDPISATLAGQILTVLWGAPKDVVFYAADLKERFVAGEDASKRALREERFDKAFAHLTGKDGRVSSSWKGVTVNPSIPGDLNSGLIEKERAYARKLVARLHTPEVITETLVEREAEFDVGTRALKVLVDHTVVNVRETDKVLELRWGPQLTEDEVAAVLALEIPSLTPLPARPTPNTDPNTGETVPFPDLDERSWRVLYGVIERGAKGARVLHSADKPHPLVTTGYYQPTTDDGFYRFASAVDDKPEYADPDVWDAVLTACADIVSLLRSPNGGCDQLDALRGIYRDRYAYDEKGQRRLKIGPTPWGEAVVDLATRRLDGTVIRRVPKGWVLEPSGKTRPDGASAKAYDERPIEGEVKARKEEEAAAAAEAAATVTTATPDSQGGAISPVVIAALDTELSKLPVPRTELEALQGIFTVLYRVLVNSEQQLSRMSSLTSEVRRSTPKPRTTVEYLAEKFVLDLYIESRPRPSSWFRNWRASKTQKALVDDALALLEQKGVFGRREDGSLWLIDPTRFRHDLTWGELEARAAEKRSGLMDKAESARAAVVEKAGAVFGRDS